MLDDKVLDEVDCTKLLGIHLDRGLTWRNHVDSPQTADCASLFLVPHKPLPQPLTVRTLFPIIRSHRQLIVLHVSCPPQSWPPPLTVRNLFPIICGQTADCA
ncbi:hypothetical protein J6590_018434 [Homalodisca vitripennis]|nr:hypothetical protein J6590_018434 [Homalodisca vitripennis]